MNMAADLFAVVNCFSWWFVPPRYYCIAVYVEWNCWI